MRLNIGKEVAALRRMSTQDLLAKYAELFGEVVWKTGNRVWLVKRIVWRMQALDEGDLSERARRRAAELVHEADLRLSAPPTGPTSSDPKVPLRWPTDERLPRLGTILTRRYKGRAIQVEVLDHGFACDGQVYRSLSAVAKAVTGSHCSGHFFFGLTTKGQD